MRRRGASLLENMPFQAVILLIVMLDLIVTIYSLIIGTEAAEEIRNNRYPVHSGISSSLVQLRNSVGMIVRAQGSDGA